jgi:hypothetical protein
MNLVTADLRGPADWIAEVTSTATATDPECPVSIARAMEGWSRLAGSRRSLKNRTRRAGPIFARAKELDGHLLAKLSPSQRSARHAIP